MANLVAIYTKGNVKRSIEWLKSKKNNELKFVVNSIIDDAFLNLYKSSCAFLLGRNQN